MPPWPADSSRKLPGRPAVSLRCTPTGVSPSAKTSRSTGITRWSAARARNASRVVVPGAGTDGAAGRGDSLMGWALRRRRGARP
ncbi:hypothetical protein BC477_13125 [Clavibacter michiganensis subsp. michiganensis]|uniref:Uncharacterized protein n=1 Tax=Clavibacter michiganensis subsp. michiganensis TaxID=33013 RepID=A0A251XHU2_CLAMM|nr:hypothetical protein BC477_13125 [Clavibacter michiganensis subsp. michiganensis]OUE02738.1 hypothetical protein CMMCAS07_12030 [Clavibacter michiganensis subsp. michiganensis]